VKHWSRDTATYYDIDGVWRTERDEAVGALAEGRRQAARIDVRDGVLTAYEVSGLDLRGTELVNLTACQTGQGDVTADGVTGLRQAFILAGARSVTMSMWEVPAQETVDQMTAFYQAWHGRSGAADTARYPAFHRAQRDALAKARTTYGSAHPFHWAGTVFVGDPGDLPGAPGSPIIAQATRR
jgi:CHAT domain-containing protein